MTETTVRYHAEMWHDARPAINVKCYQRGPDDTFDRLERNIGTRETERLYEGAWDMLVETFWDQAADESERLGLGPIESEGRMGGWLVFTDGRDPQDPATLHSPLEGRDAGPCADPAPDTLGDDPGVCTTCFWQVADHTGKDAAVAEWLAAYRAMTDWCRDYIAAVPAELDRIALEIANAEAVAP